jgi:hypothetical protein
MDGGGWRLLSDVDLMVIATTWTDIMGGRNKAKI